MEQLQTTHDTRTGFLVGTGAGSVEHQSQALLDYFDRVRSDYPVEREFEVIIGSEAKKVKVEGHIVLDNAPHGVGLRLRDLATGKTFVAEIRMTGVADCLEEDHRWVRTSVSVDEAISRIRAQLDERRGV